MSNMSMKDAGNSKIGVGAALNPSTDGRRITVRLHGSAIHLLERRHQQTGQNLSEIVRNALQFALQAGSDEGQRIPDSQFRQKVPSSYTFPRDLQPLLPQYRVFGTQIWQERRRCFGALLAICELVREQTGSPQDQALCAETLRIGKLYGLLR